MLGFFKHKVVFTLAFLSGLFGFIQWDKGEIVFDNNSNQNAPQLPLDVTYLALGDSYTIGTGLAEGDFSFPIQLATRLDKDQNINCSDVKIVAKNGWTTSDLLNGMKSVTFDTNYTLVSLLIGVNNQYQHESIEKYELEFDSLLNKAIALANNNRDHVFVLSIPDYGVTPFGKSKAAEIKEEINRYNALNKSICTNHQVSYFDITDISRAALNTKYLLAPDSLHPSGKMYGLWIDSFFPLVKSKLNS